MTNKNPSDMGTDSRVIRVFISSTFRDMMRERDLLVKQVFPELRRICAKRFVTFTEVDLRWGITEEQAAEGKVLPLCLAEIHRCRPYFIGLLGERYGWVPGSIPAEVIENEPWLNEHLHGRTSVTELEILHGVLNNPPMQSHAFFYFRNPGWIDSLPEADRLEMIERDIPHYIEQYGAEEAVRRTQERKKKLAALKNRIRESGLPLVEDYVSPEALAGMIRDQFKELIDLLYPEEDVPDALDRERLAHVAHAKNRLFACIERPEHIAALNRFADSNREGKGLVITGESGGGKSVLLAAWARDRAQDHPDDFLFQHYFGSTPESSSVDSFLRRLLGDLKRRFDIEEEIPTESDKLREALPLWLVQTAGKGAQIVLVLDGLNQIQGDEPDRQLIWMPHFFRPHVTALASTLPGPGLDTLQKRGWREYNLPLASEDEIEAMVDAYLNEYRRTLEPELKRDLVNAPGSKNPLFLRTVLEELRQFGSFKKLPDRVAHYLEAGNPLELFQLVLRRWQEDFDSGRELVRGAASFLWAARMGLSESEWLDLLGESGAPMPRALWAPLFLAMEPHLTQRAGLLTFGHDFLRQAVAAEFLQTDSDQRATHLVLADYFAAEQEMTIRKSEEWPWQLQEAEEWDRLQEALADQQLFLSLFKNQTDVGLGRYWVRLREAKPTVEMGKLYLEVYAQWEAAEPETSAVALLEHRLGRFLSNNACYDEAEQLYRRALEIDEQCHGASSPEVAASLNNLAILLVATDRPSEAEPLLRRALEIDEQFSGPEDAAVAICLNSLAELLRSTNRLSEAELLYRRALDIYERFYKPDNPAVAACLNNLAELLRTTSRLSEAELLYRRALDIEERSLGKDHPLVALVLNNLGLVLAATNRPSEAEPLYRRALEIYENSHGPDHPGVAAALNNLGVLLKDTNRLSEAEPVCRRALEIDERRYGPEHTNVAISLNNLGLVLKATNHPSEAEPLYQRSLEIRERSLGQDHPLVAVSLNNLGIVLEEKNRLSEAESLYRRALEIDEESLGQDHPSVATSLGNLAGLLKDTNRLKEAERLHRRALAIREQSFGRNHPFVAISLNDLGLLLANTNRLSEAEPLHRRALEIRERSLGRDHPEIAVSLTNLAELLRAANRLSEAEPLMRQALEINEQAYEPNHPSIAASVSNLATLLYSANRLSEAEPLIHRALEIYEKSVGPDHPELATSLNNLAELLGATNRPAEAEPLIRRALAIYEKSLGPSCLEVATCLTNLAELLGATNRPSEAEPLMRRVLEIYEEFLGPSRPEVATSLSKLARLLRATNRPSEAEPLMRKALEIYEKCLGPHHPDVATSLNNLAMLL